MAEKVFTPETIEDTPFPNQVSESQSVSQSTSNDTFIQPSIKEQPLPTSRIAQELIGAVLNTKSKKIKGDMEIVDLGAFRAGTFDPGISGEVVMTKNGITAKDLAGIVTFALDALTGDAVFKGELRSGSLITGEIIVGNNTIIIDGDSDKPRILLHVNNIPSILLGVA